MTPSLVGRLALSLALGWVGLKPNPFPSIPGTCARMGAGSAMLVTRAQCIGLSLGTGHAPPDAACGTTWALMITPLALEIVPAGRLWNFFTTTPPPNVLLTGVDSSSRLGGIINSPFGWLMPGQMWRASASTASRRPCSSTSAPQGARGGHVHRPRPQGRRRRRGHAPGNVRAADAAPGRRAAGGRSAGAPWLGQRLQRPHSLHGWDPLTQRPWFWEGICSWQHGC